MLLPVALISVGVAAIQVGHMIEATVVAVTRTDAKRMWLLEVGADEVIVSQEEGGLFMGVLETVKSLVGVRLPVVVDKSRGCLLSMCAEACAWGFEVTVRSRVRGLGVFGSGSRMLWLWRESPSAVLGTRYSDVIET